MNVDLVELFRNLFFNPVETQKYLDNPTQYLHDSGIESASYEEINEAAVLACSGPVSQGAVVTTGGAAGAASSGPVSVGGGASAGGYAGGSGAPAAAMPPATQAPPPPPPPPADMPPAEAVQSVVQYYVTEVTNTTEVTEITNVDDRDTNVDNSVTSNILAEEGADVNVHVDNDAVTASGDGAVAAGEDAEGVATGDGAVAAGEDIAGNVNTGTNSGVIGDDADIDDSIFGDDNVQANDNDGPVTVGDGNTVVTDSEGVATGDGSTAVGEAEGPVVSGDHNVVAADGSQAAGGDLTDNDTQIDIDNSDLHNVGFGSGDVTQDNSANDSFNTEIDSSVDNTDSFNTDASVNDSFDNTDSFNTDASVNDSFDNTDSFNTDASITDSFDVEDNEQAEEITIDL